jgi:serine/threonine protein kinase
MAEPTLLGGRYEIGPILGRGGMAAVYLGTDRVLGRPVAVKVLGSQFSDDASFVARFRREAQAAAALNHPNLVGVFDTGSDGSTHYIVMEYVEGRTLAEALRDGGPLLPERAAEIAEGVATALAFAHAAGLVHRDVKPGNVMLTPTGDVKVMDFGIARAAASDSLTQTATVLGTASYFAPEQASGEVVDGRSDIYSLGCVLYEMLTGRPPFTGDTAVAVAYQHVREDPTPPSRINREVPPPLEAIVMKCLAKNPANRYQDADELRADLEAFRTGRPVSATPLLAASMPTQAVARVAPGTRVMPAVPGGERDRDEGDRRTWIIAGIVALALLLIAALLFFFLRPASTTTVTVPNVTGISSKAACDQLRHNNLKCRISKQASDTVPKGDVIDYTPKGAVAAGSTINLVVSAGKPTTAVPDVVCEDKATAESDLQAAGFQPLVAGHRTNAACPTPGLVSAQSPSSPNGGTKAPRGSIVRIYLVPQPTPSPSPSTSPSPSPSPSTSPTVSPTPSPSAT